MLSRPSSKSKSSAPLKNFQSAERWLKPTLLAISASFLVACAALDQMPVKQTTTCVATEPVLSDFVSLSGVDLAAVDFRTLEVVYQQTIPESTSLVLLPESDLAELATYIEQLRQCVHNL